MADDIERFGPRVFVLRTDEGYRVRPAYVGVRLGLGVRVCNLTGDRITLFLGDADITLVPAGEKAGRRGAPKAAGRLVEVGPGQCQSFAVLAPRALRKYPYTVYVHEGRTFAEGESCPEIIVEP
jgi:hypothetical protein